MSADQWTYNIGEWSEAYTFLKLLADGKLHAADSRLAELPDVYYPILQILRQESDDILEYTIVDGTVRITRRSSYAPLLELPISTFSKKSKYLLQKMRERSHRTFAIPETEAFLRKIFIDNPKSPSGDKRDITIVIPDQHANYHHELGFSVKSRIGGLPTLFNASNSSNFVYEIQNLNLNEREVAKINEAGPIYRRVQEIESLGGKFAFRGIQGNTFENNMRVIDTALPEIFSLLLLAANRKRGFRALKDVANLIEKENPLRYHTEENHPFYTYKIRRFLVEVALGMTAGSVWTGTHDATGGYIVVREDGVPVCYHIINFNDFENYLLHNVSFETPSTSRYGFGRLEKANNDFIFKLNLQLRFTGPRL